MKLDRLNLIKIFSIFFVALLVRIALTVGQYRYKFLSANFYAGDTIHYDLFAQSIAAAGEFLIDGQPSAIRTPGYPLFLALLYTIVGRDFFVISLIQCFIGAGCCFFLFGMARRVFDDNSAFVATLFFALAPNMILSTSGYILTEGLFIFLSLAALYCLIRLLSPEENNEGKQSIFVVLAGITLALASLTRPVLLYFSILAIIYLSVKSSWKKSAIVFACFALFMSLWAIRNYQVFGQPIFSTTAGGWVLYEYHNPDTTASNGGMNPEWTPDGSRSPQVPRFKEAEILSEIELNKFYLEKSISFALENPVKEVELSFNRFWNVWRPTYAAAKGYTKLISWVTYILLMLVALPAIFYYGFRNSKHGLLVLFLFYHIIFYAFVVAELRFRFPLEPVLMIYAGGGVTFLISFVKRKFFKTEIGN